MSGGRVIALFFSHHASTKKRSALANINPKTFLTTEDTEKSNSIDHRPRVPYFPWLNILALSFMVCC